MKHKLCLILFFVILFNCKEAFSIEKLSKALYLDEQFIVKYDSFCENGVKCNYIINGKAENEINRINLLLLKYKDLNNIKINNNYLEAKTEDEEISIYTYTGKIGCKVEIKIVNYDKEDNINKLIKELIKLQNNNGNDIRYFSYIKSRVNNIEETLKNLENNKNLKGMQTININNGYTGIAKYKNEKINFAINNYDTGSYLVIGTPIIFTTY
ncbi:MAG: hypothetical protein SOY42_13150 [Clostridium sp.]|nr:hypothetical protein [Clostridium sp.]